MFAHKDRPVILQCPLVRPLGIGVGCGVIFIVRVKAKIWVVFLGDVEEDT